MATQREVASHLSLDHSAVSRMLSAGELPSRGGRGNLDLDACREAYIRRLREQAAGRMGHEGESLDLATERARLAAAQADAQAMKNATSRGELLPRADVTAAVQMAFARVRARLLAIPSRAAPIVVPMTSAQEVQAKLTDLVHEALAELAATQVTYAPDKKPVRGAKKP